MPTKECEKTELVNPKALSKLLSLGIQIKYNGEFINSETLKKLKSYSKKIKNGSVKIKYKQNSYGYGRLYAIAGLGLQSFWRPIRHTLCGEYYYDIDMVNAQPTILYQFCLSKSIDTPKLKFYVENRTTVIESLKSNT